MSTNTVTTARPAISECARRDRARELARAMSWRAGQNASARDNSARRILLNLTPTGWGCGCACVCVCARVGQL
eukprot:2633071-Pyramimonas_sp.AAC.1